MIDDEDKALFRKAMRDVTPLSSKTSTHQEPNKTKQQKLIKVVKKAHVSAKRNITPLSDGFSNNIKPHESMSFARDGIDTSIIKKMQKGTLRPLARLDLHAMRREHAHHELDDFLTESYRQQLRVVLIIHGKGQGVMKNLVNNWLQQYPFVLAFQSAHPRDGGTGATYVLLKRASYKS